MLTSQICQYCYPIQAAFRYNHYYYNKSQSLISDQEYDQIFGELMELESKYPQFQSMVSPTAKVGAPVSIIYGFANSRIIR